MTSKICLLLSLLLLINFISFGECRYKSSSSPEVHCVDDSGQKVDWFIVYKFPYLKSSNKPDLFGGYHYAYMSSKTQTGAGWQFSTNQVTDDKKSIFARTMAPYFSTNRSHLTAMFYNDQPPTNHDVPSSYAHAKGVLMSNDQQGFWLIHTVPRFIPADQNKYEYPKTGGRYGQVSMCITLSVNELAKLVKENFLVARPYVYHLLIERNQEKKPLGQALSDLEQHKWSNDKDFSELELKSMGGVTFKSFYKSPHYEVDLYADIVAKQMKTSLRAETWRHPPGGPLGSECKIKQAEVENIERIQVAFDNSKLKGQFSSYDDHSKWAISRDHEHDMTCVGDINRVHSQFHRGGGTTCIYDATVWTNFNSFINKVDKCPDDKYNDNNRDMIEENDDDPIWIPSDQDYEEGWWMKVMRKVGQHFENHNNNYN